VCGKDIKENYRIQLYLILIGKEVLAASIIREITLMMKAASETLVNLYQTTWRYNPEDSHLCIVHISARLLTTLAEVFPGFHQCL
jgi:hypothetical protein